MSISPAFENHIVICGWNSRGARVVTLLQAISKRPLLIVHTDLTAVRADLRNMERLCFMQGDSTIPQVLKAAEVAQAHSVLVLSDDSLGIGTDARSVQIALAVERIRSAVYSVVEVRDLRNKAHFSRTKVDDIVSDQKVAVCLVAQGIRHLSANASLKNSEHSVAAKKERDLLKVYNQLLNPFQNKSQVFRLELPAAEMGAYTFQQVLHAGLAIGILPVSLVGYSRHEHRSPLVDRAHWISWKTHNISNPEPNKPIKEFWEGWPGEEFPLGVLYLGKAANCSDTLSTAFLQKLRNVPNSPD